MSDYNESERTSRTIARCVAAVVITLIISIPGCNWATNQQILSAMKAGASANAASCALSAGGSGSTACAVAGAEGRR